jgi:hypothetical protein
VKLLAGQMYLHVQKQIKIAGSKVWAVSWMVSTFTVVISVPLPPVLYLQFLDNHRITSAEVWTKVKMRVMLRAS